MNRRIEHRDLEDTEPEDLPALCVLPISALRHGSASHTPRFMAAMRVQSWRSRLSMRRSAFPAWRWVIACSVTIAAASARNEAAERAIASQFPQSANGEPAVLRTAEQIHRLTR